MLYAGWELGKKVTLLLQCQGGDFDAGGYRPLGNKFNYSVELLVASQLRGYVVGRMFPKTIPISKVILELKRT